MPRSNSVLAIMACALLPLALMGRTPGHDSIVEQIEGLAGTTGVSRVSHELYRDWLNQGAQQLVSFDLDANVRYYLLGACDEDCAELHFELLRPDGSVLSHNGGVGPRPVVTVEPPRAGKYQLRAAMRQCSIQPCEWGVRVYRR